MKKLSFTLISVILLVFTSCNVYSQNGLVKLVGTNYTDFSIPKGSLDGSTAKLSDYAGKGKYLLVDFWAPWCGPCKAEIPYVKDVYANYAGKDFDVLSVAVFDNNGSDESSAKAAIKDYDMKWNHIINGGLIPSGVYGFKGIPFIILIDPDGKIVAVNLRHEQIEETVSKYVDKNK